ncbi:OLC1v1004910C1 [Oldenlandia corymbosa var. corymbosa]|uniref:OLC1v1004910C1 n=1 Tax=Oldenlandia corymbosa var. corymbosa TaxID=529605 RepID=A0AAV1DEP3_OLDCO|nr:OLC1v1004910C1 [Oldenlandia corymbosa var. corymbosa]
MAGKNGYGFVNRVRSSPGFWSEPLALVIFALGIQLVQSANDHSQWQIQSVNDHSQWQIAVLEFCFVILFPLLNIYVAWSGYAKEFLCGGVLEETLLPDERQSNGTEKFVKEEKEIRPPNMMVPATLIDDSIAPKIANNKEEIQTYLNNGNDDDSDKINNLKLSPMMMTVIIAMKISNLKLFPMLMMNRDDGAKNQQSEVVSNGDDGDASNEDQQSDAEGMLDKIQRGSGNALEKIQDKGLTAKEKQSGEICCEFAKEEEIRRPNMKAAAATTLTDESTSQNGANDDEKETETYLNDDDDGNDDNEDDSDENQLSDEHVARLETISRVFYEMLREWEKVSGKIQDEGTAILYEISDKCFEDFQELKDEIDELQMRVCTATNALLEEFQKDCQKLKEESSEWEMKKEDDYQCPKEQHADELSTTLSTSTSSSTTEESFLKESQKTEE